MDDGTGHYPRKVIWICHALTADSDVEDWWPELAGPGKLFDTDRYFVICVNMLGSCYGSSGPASIDPSTGKPYYFNFPKITVRDIVRALNMVRESLGIEHIDLLIGASIGGFQALEMSIMYPDVVRRAAFMATLPRVTPWLTAFEESQRMALEADPSFRACESLEGGRKGLECARSIALLSYRCEDGYNRKQYELEDDTLFAQRACTYQQYQGEKLSRRFDAYSYWYLSLSLDSHNVGRGRGGIWKALGRIRADSIVIAIDSDLIFPPYEMKQMADAIPGARYKEFSSHFGHDGFLIESEAVTAIVGPILEAM
jgi:homoserine O-acetyltransferase